MSKPDYVAELGAHLSAVPDDESNKAHWFFGYVTEWLVARIDQLYHDLGGAPGVKAFIEEAYKKHVEPIDIPGVPNVIVEPYLDKTICDALVAAALAAHHALHPEAEAQ